MAWNLNQLRGVVLVAVLAVVSSQPALAGKHHGSHGGGNGGGNNGMRIFSAKSFTPKFTQSTPMLQTTPVFKTAPAKRWQVFSSGQTQLGLLNSNENKPKKFLQQSNTANVWGIRKKLIGTPITPAGPLVGTIGPVTGTGKPPKDNCHPKGNCHPKNPCYPKGGCWPGISFPIFCGGYCGNYGGGYCGTTTVVVADQTVPVTQSVGMVDLVLEDIRLVQPATVVAGPAYQVKFRNQGTRAVGTFKLGLYAALDGKMIEGATAVVQVPSMAAGEVGEMILRLPASAVQLTSTASQSTTFSDLVIAIDPDNRIVESNKTNNGTVVARTALEAQQQ